MTIRSRFSLAVAAVWLIVPLSWGIASAAPTSLIQIEQVSSGPVGNWTLISADGSARTSADPGVDKLKHAMSLSEFSPLTLAVTPPAGMSVKISTYRGGELKSTSDTPQLTITPYPNDSYRFVIQYALTKLGTLGVTSTPSGLRIRVKGPVGRVLTSVTPHTFVNIPAGRYTVTASAKRGCLQPAQHSIIVQPETRNAILITLTCDDATSDTPVRTRPTKRSLIEAVEARERKPRGERK